MREALQRLAASISAFEQADIGYPKGAHGIRSPEDAATVASALRSLKVSASSRLNDFYTWCDGISLPDVENACFIYALRQLVSINNMQSEPNRFGDRPVVIWGIDGGGGRFVVTLDSDEVYYLPVGAVSSARVYSGAGAERVAPSIDEWLELLTERVQQASQSPDS